jgi:hypothetical protein
MLIKVIVLLHVQKDITVILMVPVLYVILLVKLVLL